MLSTDLIAKFDADLMDFLSKKHLEVVRLFNINQTKRTATLLVKQNNGSQKFVLKWHKQSAPERTKIWFSNELDFLQTHQNLNVVPHLIESGEQYLLLENFDGVTLREWLENYLVNNSISGPSEDLIRVIENLFEATKLLFSDAKYDRSTSESREQFEQKILSTYNGLCLSGPMGTRRSRLEWAVSKVLNLLSRRRFGKFVKNWFSSLEQPLLLCWTHGDLHLNNILVSGSYKINFVDFATSSQSGLVLLDLLYLQTTLKATLSQSASHLDVLEDFAQKLFPDLMRQELQLAKRLQVVLDLAASINSRFQHRASIPSLLKAQAAFFPLLLRATRF